MFEDRITALNKEETEIPLPYEKRIYTVDEIQDILGIGRIYLPKSRQEVIHYG